MSEAERFLLTGLPETQRQRMEEQLLLDDGLFEEVLAAEDDLIDAAARGELDPQSQERLAHLPDLQQRLAFARQLARTAAQHRTEEPPRSIYRRWGPWLSAAALLLLAIGLGSAFLEDSTAEFVLRPTGLRGDGPELVIAARTDHIELHLELTQDFEERRFRAMLRTRSGDQVRRWEELTSQRFDWGTSVVIDLPAEELSPGSYAAHLLSTGADGDEQKIDIYSFTVVRAE